MANRYANLTPNKQIKDDFGNITIGFDRVQADMDNEISARQQLEQRVDTIIQGGGPGKDGELVDIRTPDPSYTPGRTINVAGDLTRDMQKKFVDHSSDRTKHVIDGQLDSDISLVNNNLDSGRMISGNGNGGAVRFRSSSDGSKTRDIALGIIDNNRTFSSVIEMDNSRIMQHPPVYTGSNTITFSASREVQNLTKVNLAKISIPAAYTGFCVEVTACGLRQNAGAYAVKKSWIVLRQGGGPEITLDINQDWVVTGIKDYLFLEAVGNDVYLRVSSNDANFATSWQLTVQIKAYYNATGVITPL